jgi:hemerythrin-like metal-binding protein
MADFFTWDPSKLALDIPEMDEEHQQIIECMNRLHQLSEAGARRMQLAQAYEALAAVTQKHFKDEEGYMERIGFADLAKHRIVHRHLLERLAGFRKQFDDTGVFKEDFFFFLKMWLKSHICGIDTRYAEIVHAA